MRFEYLLLADAANNGPDGKLNVLGAGVRILTYDALPGLSPLVITGSVSAEASEAGEYPLRVVLIAPDSTEEVLAHGSAAVRADVEDERVPTGIAFTVSMLRPFAVEGLYRVVAEVGATTRDYPFLVRTRASKAEDSTAAAARERRGRGSRRKVDAQT